MKGLVYRENMMFIKSLDKKTSLIVVAAVIALIFVSGEYAGPFASVMFALVIGMQNVAGIANDEKADWKKYQMAMPVSAVTVIEAKYVSVLCTTAISLLGSIVFNIVDCVIFRHFNVSVIITSMVIAVTLPILWAGISLPLAYWFGYGCSRVISFIGFFPIFYSVKYFEEIGLFLMIDSIAVCALIMGIGSVVIFAVSMIISVAGYKRKV